MIVLLFSNSYPYDYATEQTFLKGEVEILRKRFDKVVLVPRIAKGNLLPLPEGVEVDTSFASSFTMCRRLAESALAMFSKDFYLDIKNRLPSSLKPSYLRRVFSFIAGANLTRKWMKNWLKSNCISASDVVCYTFWFDELAMGIGLAKRKHPVLKVVSRAHGYDLYEELYGDWPCRLRAIEMTDGVYSVSEAGQEYLQKKYPAFKEKYGTFRLGVPDPGRLSVPSEDGVLRVVSCSMIYDIKRVDLLLEGIACAARKRSVQCIEWRHFGDGDMREQLRARAEDELPPNAKSYLPGFISQKELIKSYIETPVDVFVNVSSTEGTPVSIMEAMSCSIPVIATAVGGNVEVAGEKNGLLLSANPTPNEIADALLSVCDNRESWLKKRQGSREVWQERYNETTNFEAFAQKLVEIRKR